MNGGKPLGRVSGILVAMGIVGAGFIIGLNFGFIYNHEPAPPPLPSLFYPAIPVFLLCCWLLIRSLRLSSIRPRLDVSALDVFGIGESRTAAKFSELARQRLELLEADPGTRPYATKIRAGEQWSDDAIAYDRDPTSLVTCEHMRPIERALRDSGIGIRLKGYGYLDAPCCVDDEKLAQRFHLGTTVQYNVVGGDRPGEPNSAFIACREHRMPIMVIVPEDATPGTPWFPV